MYRKCALLGCLGILLLPVALRAAPRPPTEDAEPVSHVTVAVTDFPGEDKALGHFLSDTLLTDLGHSDRLQTLERNELQQALADLDMRDNGPMTPGQVRHLGDLIHASRIVVGSFLVRDDQVVINARLLDTQSGLILPGSAINVAGNRKSLLGVTHKLAKQLCRRLTGEDLLLDDEGDGKLLPQEKEIRPQEPAPFLPEEIDALEPYKRSGLIPSGAHANSPLAERDLAGFIGRLAKRITPQSDSGLRLGQTAAPVSRLQALAALVKMIISPADIAAFRNTPVSDLTPDGAQVPLWGQPYLAAALDQRWWDSASPLRSREIATWGFIQTLLDHVLEREAPRPAPRHSDPPVVTESFTGLIIDARDFDLQRDHSPTIVDEDGHTVYPDPKHVPSPDYVDANGMASYGLEEGDAHRSGAHPLIIRALGVTGPGPFDVIVSNEDARRIVEANRRSKFLWKWNVTLLVR